LRIPKLRKGSFFPAHSRTPMADQSGPLCGGDGGLRQRGLHAGGRRPRASARRRVRDLEVGGLPDLRRAR
jgi:hypothetical protein